MIIACREIAILLADQRIDRGFGMQQRLTAQAFERRGLARLEAREADGCERSRGALAPLARSHAQERQRQRHVVADIEIGQQMKGLEHEAQVAPPPER
jgi:hypothetical protein